MLNKRHLWFIGLTAIMTLPFRDKAVHIDETSYLYVARQILLDPLHPYNFQYNWYGISSDATNIITAPPLLSYYFALFIAFFGENETVLHSAMFVFPLLAIYSMYYLAARFTDKPMEATLLLILSPSFFVAASTLMLDIPVLALAIASTALFIHGLDTNNRIILCVSGIVLGLACLIKYWAILHFGIHLFYAWQQDKTRKSFISLVPAFLILGGWSFLNYLNTGMWHLLYAKRIMSSLSLSVTNKLTTFISFSGVCFLIAGCFLYQDKKQRLITMGVVSFLSLCILSVWSDLGLFQGGMLFLFAINGAYLLTRVLTEWVRAENWKNPDTLFLLIWFSGTLLFILTQLAFMAARHLLIFLTPMILLLFREKRIGPRFNPIFTINLLLAFCIAMGISFGDYNYANSYREFAHSFFKDTNLSYKKGPKENRRLGGKKETESFSKKEGVLSTQLHTPAVWILTHWGFQYYMENKNARILESGNVNSVRKDDWLINTVNSDHSEIPEKIKPYLQHVRTVNKSYSWPVRIIDLSLNAGWYSSGAGPLPFTIDFKSPLETFIIYKVIDQPS